VLFTVFGVLSTGFFTGHAPGKKGKKAKMLGKLRKKYFQFFRFSKKSI
jgi:hypothetical protein